MEDKINNALKHINDNLGPSVYSVYLKGSYLMKEMLPKSDIDLVVIFKENSRAAFDKIKGHEVVGPVSISGFSLEELRTGERYGLAQGPKTFMHFVKHYKLIQGNSVLGKGFPIKTPKEVYEDHKGFLIQEFIPNLEKKYSMTTLSKQVLWLSFNELTMQGKNPPYSYKKINDLLDLNHIGKRAYNIRLGFKDDMFLKDLISYLS
jgi:hypothetical protein